MTRRVGRKTVLVNQFDNALGDLITESFWTKEELEYAIQYYGKTTIAERLKDMMEAYEV